MPSVLLRSISNRPAGSSMNARRLRYELETVDDWLIDLTAILPVTYVFAYANEGSWDGVVLDHWKNAFKRNAEQTWSRRWVVRGESFFGSVLNVRVRLQVIEESFARQAADQWYVAFYPPDHPPPNGIVTQYAVRGSLAGTPHALPGGDGGAVCFLQWYSVGCGHYHVAADQAAPENAQRGSDHEVGHMLGMQHPYCNEYVDGGGRSCYARGQPQDLQIMGIGSEVTQADYHWAKALIEQDEQLSGYTWSLVAPQHEPPSDGFTCRSERIPPRPRARTIP